MASPFSLITSYPPEEIDLYLKDKEKLYVYVDLKNVMTALFVPDVENQIVQNTKNSGSVDSSIFQACIAYASYWKRFAHKRALDCKVFFCADTGRSVYHMSLLKEYKIRRQVSNYGSDISGALGEDIKKIRDKNFSVCNKSINRLPDIYFFNLHYLESDFLCHYLITRKFNFAKDTLHVICSSDKDLMQTLYELNAVMVHKKKGQRCLLDYGNYMCTYVGIDKLSEKTKKTKIEKISQIDSRFVPAIMALVGDSGDDIPGVKGIGPNKAIDIFSYHDLVKKIIGTPDELNERVSNGGNFFLEDKVGLSKLPKIWQKVIIENETVTKAYKLISFEMLIDWLHKPDDTSKKNWIEYIDNILSKKSNTIQTSKTFMEGASVIPDFQLSQRDILPIFEREYFNNLV